MIGVGLIGYGYWGPNLLRNFSEAAGARVVAVSDLRPDRLKLAETRLPGIRATAEHGALIEDRQVDAVAIVTPVSTHFDLGMQALRAGKHVLVAKPLAATTQQAERLAEEAERRGLVLLVDHTFVYAAAVRKIRDLLRDGQLGDVHYYDSVRVNLGLFQYDVNVLWDLAVHDLSILDYLFPTRPRAVSAIGISHVPGRPENTAYLTLHFDERFIAHIHASWLAPVKVRRTLISGADRMVVYDDLEPSEKVKLYDSGITLTPDREAIYQMLVDYRFGDMWAPKLERVEPLQAEVADFVACVAGGGRPEADAAAGVRLVRILEAANRSLARGGERVPLEPK